MLAKKVYPKIASIYAGVPRRREGLHNQLKLTKFFICCVGLKMTKKDFFKRVTLDCT